MRPSFDGVTFRWARGIPPELSGVAEDAGLLRDVDAGVEDPGVGDGFASSDEPHALVTASMTASATTYRIL